MNTTTPSGASSPSSHGTAAAGHAHGGHASARGTGKPGHGTAGPADPFASLLSLLNAGNELATDATVPTLDASAEKATDDPSALAQDSAQNPLAGLLGWPGAPLPVLPSTQGTAAETAGARRLSLLGDAAADSFKGRKGTGQTVDGLSASPATTAALATGQRTDGLTPTTAPETLDADTLAALARANATGDPGTAADAARAAAPMRITAWRSTAGLAPQAAGLAAAQALAQGAPAHASVSQATFAQDSLARPNGADAAALGAQVRSTVQLDERFAPTGSDNGSSSSTPIGSASGTAGARHEALPGDAGAGAGGTGNGAGQEAGPDLSQGFGTPGDDRNASDAAAWATAEADDSASAGWGAQHLRHASVRVGEPGEQAIDIQLSMAGQEVRVEFRTDDAQTRASLAQDGGASLGELLQRSGIDLGGVSVGAQGQQAGQDPSTRTPQGQTAPVAHRGREADAPAASTAQPPRPRADGSRPLDLFV